MSRLPPDRPRRPPARPRGRLRPADPASPERRDTQPAGRVLVVMVSALLAAAVLNAQALLHDAKTKPLGTSRTVSVAIWAPVARVAAVFALDRPRNAVEAALGRDDEVPPVSVSAPGPPPGPTAAGNRSVSPVAAGRMRSDPAPLRASADDPLQVLLVGDSTMTAVGGALTRALAATGVAATELDARPASGFSRPDFFDWPTRLSQLTSRQETDLTIAMFGANDAQGFEHDGRVHDFGTDSWVAIYRARVATAMDILTEGGGRVIWIGQPTMRSRSFDARMRVIDDIARSEASQRPGVTFVDSRSVLSGPDGGYAEYVVSAGGDRVHIRDGDGVHLTTAGADLLARAVLEPVLSELSVDGP